MKKYCAFIKQVSFRKQFVKMAELKSLFENLCFRNVDTVYATGNVIFTSKKPKDKICSILKSGLSEYYNFNIDVFVRDLEEVKEILDGNPFEIQEDFHIQMFICDDGFSAILFEEFGKIKLPKDDKIFSKNGSFYWYRRKKETDADNDEHSRVISRAKLKHEFTIRTIGTMKKVYEKMTKPKVGLKIEEKIKI